MSLYQYNKTNTITKRQPQSITGRANKMKTIRTKVYQFNELSDDAKRKAIEWYISGNAFESFAWDNIKEDAEQIGLNLISLDDSRPNKGEFIQDADHCAELIIENHGSHCNTYKTAAKYLDDRSKLDIDEQDDELSDLDDEFLQSILEDYRIMYNKEVEYEYSDEYAIEAITANEYDFTADGKRFHQ